MITAGDLTIDRERYRVILRGAFVELTYLEFNALWAIASEAGRVATYERLAEALWGAPSARTRRRLAVIVSRLRSKLGETGAVYIETVTRVGYRFAWE